MDIKADATLPFDRTLVFETYRDQLPELTDYLPNIRSIRVLERKELDRGDVELVNEWVGGGDIPAIARSVIKESMLRWTDYATWHADDFTCDWRTETHAFTEAFTSGGTNRYVATADGARLEIRGTLRCDSSKIPGVPRFMQAKVNRTVEALLARQIAGNLQQVAKGVTRWLKERGAEPSAGDEA